MEIEDDVSFHSVSNIHDEEPNTCSTAVSVTSCSNSPQFQRSTPKRPAPPPPVVPPAVTPMGKPAPVVPPAITPMAKPGCAFRRRKTSGMEASSPGLSECLVEVPPRKPSTTNSLNLRDAEAEESYVSFRPRLDESLRESTAQNLTFSHLIYSDVQYPNQKQASDIPVSGNLPLRHLLPSNATPPLFFATSGHPMMSHLSTDIPLHPYLPAQLISMPTFNNVPQLESPLFGNPIAGKKLDHLSSRRSQPKLSSGLKKLPEEAIYEDDIYSDDEVDESSDSRKTRRSSLNESGRRLNRTDSEVTVGNLYEDLLVSQKFHLKLTLTNLSMVVLLAAFLVPNLAAFIYTIFRLVFGTLFPAYYSYKAVRTKNVKEYVKWMMYWIVFALFTCCETVTDIFLGFWFPFYYEFKILVVLWLLSPATRGSSILYRKFVHPWLTSREDEIDECIEKAKQQSYSTVLQLGSKGVNYATNIILQTALKGGGGLVNQIKRSYSTSALCEDVPDVNRNVKALPMRDYYDEDDSDSPTGQYDLGFRQRTESEGSYYKTRHHSTGRAARAAKAQTLDVSELFVDDPVELMPTRRSPRILNNLSTTGQNSYLQPVIRKSRVATEASYTTLPRAAKKTGQAKKRNA